MTRMEIDMAEKLLVALEHQSQHEPFYAEWDLPAIFRLRVTQDRAMRDRHVLREDVLLPYSYIVYTGEFVLMAVDRETAIDLLRDGKPRQPDTATTQGQGLFARNDVVI